MEDQVTRQQFLGTGARAAAALTILGSPLVTAGTALAAPLVRRDIGGLSATDPIMVSYRNAITDMQKLETSDPRSWAYQAAIHGTFTTPVETAWNTCQHGNHFFWSWHRMYLYYFERIVRAMSGDSGWALPYWDYSSPSQRQLPAMFRDPSSVLYVSARNPSMNSGAASLSASDVDHSSGFALTNFVSAGGSLEGTPHGVVHVRVGGWMGLFQAAGQDPIFWLHHCNIDRLWNLWLAQGGGRTDPTTDAAWKNTKFTFFDADKTQVTLTGCAVLRAAEQLNYTYEGEPAQIRPYCLIFPRPPWIYILRILLRWPIPHPFYLTARQTSLVVGIRPLRERLASIVENENETLLLQLQNVEALRQPGVVWKAFLGLPRGAAPDADGPYFVGNVALFGSGIRSTGGHHFRPASFSFAVDRAMQTALRSDTNNLVLTFVPTGPLVNGKPSRPRVAARVRIGRANLAVETRRRR